MSPALANFLFETANFLLLAAALGWVLFKPVRAALDRDKANHDKEAEESKQLRAEAESLAKDTRTAQETAERETARLRAELLATAQKEAAAILEAAKKDQATERRALLGELQSLRDTQTAALCDTVGSIASESVRQLLSALEGPALDLSLVRAACEQLRAFPESSRRGAMVESARTLDATAKGLLQTVLAEGFMERTVLELGAGVRVTTSAGQVDASALSFARQAAAAMKVALAQEPNAGGGENV